MMVFFINFLIRVYTINISATQGSVLAPALFLLNLDDLLSPFDMMVLFINFLIVVYPMNTSATQGSVLKPA